MRKSQKKKILECPPCDSIDNSVINLDSVLKNFGDTCGNSIFVVSQNEGKGIDLKKYAKIVIDNYRKEIDNYRKEINPRQQRLGGDFIIKRSDFENMDKFDKIVNH